MDLGNLSLGAMALGQFVSDKGFSISVFFWGVVTFIACYLTSFLISS